MFRRQMEWLAAHARVIGLRDAANGAPGVAITFDDGYRDNLVEAAPILREHGFAATVFVVAGRTGGMLAHDSDPATSMLMTWDEIRDLEREGVSIGAHSMTHPRLACLDETAQAAEVLGSAETLAKNLQHPVEAFAYPFGSAADYNTTSVRLVQQAGFSCAVSNRYGVNPPGADPWTLRRIWIDATDTMATFQAKVEGRLDVLRALDSNLGVAVRRWLNNTNRAG